MLSNAEIVELRNKALQSENIKAITANGLYFIASGLGTLLMLTTLFI